MKKTISLNMLGVILIMTLSLSAKKIPLLNPDFEDGIRGWSTLEKTPISRVTEEAKHRGAFGVRVDDQTELEGSNMRSDRMPAVAGKLYRLKFWARVTQIKTNMNVGLRFFTAEGKLAHPDIDHALGLDPTGDEFQQFTFEVIAPEGTAQVDIWIHSWTAFTTTVDLDDFELEELDASEAGKLKEVKVEKE